MAKYRTIKDFPPNLKVGDIAEFKDELPPSLMPHFEPYEGEEEVTEVDDTIITNPDRNKLKERATELEINFAPNIPTDRLIELIKEREAALVNQNDDGDGDADEDQE